MKQVPDRKKLRREYLKKKGKAYASGTVYSLLLVPALLVAYGCGVGVVMGFMWIVATLCTGRYYANVETVFLTLLSCVVCGVAGVFSDFCKREIKQAYKAISIPPVTADTLPAEEILVRGSEEPPVAQSEVLLRAVKEQETPKEELLRVSQE